jgi:hypothetical protein
LWASKPADQKGARNSSPSPHFIPTAEIKDLLRSHDELRAALIIAGKRIRKLQFGRKGDSVLVKLREVLRDARTIRKTFKQE